VFLSACADSPRGIDRPHVVLVVADTLRADRVGAWGGPAGATPFLDEIARRSVVFEQASSTSSQTVPSVLSIWSGRYPARHGNRFFPATNSFRTPRSKVRPEVGDDIPLLQEQLAEAGYAAGAVVTNPWLRRRYGFDRGFEVYRALFASGDHVRGDEVNRAVASLLETAGERRVFLYLHYMDAHPPFDPTPESLAADVDGVPGRQLDVVNDAADAIDPEDIEHTQALYRASIRDLDQRLRRLWQLFEERGMTDDLLFVFVGDHGEEFAEHGYLGHGHQLFEESIRVPWLVSHPSLRPRRVAAPTSGVDVMPTLLELLGLPVPPGVDGVSQVGVLSGEPEDRERAIYAELGDRVAVRSGATKWLAGSEGVGPWFDLAADPAELAPRATAPPAALRAAWETFRARRPADVVARPEALDPAAAEQLRQLGYLRDGETSDPSE